MTRTARRTIGTEAVIGAFINGVLSLLFGLAVFGGRTLVPVTGWRGLTADALPQTFMVSLMSLLVPRLLTRRRLLATAMSCPARRAVPSAAAIVRSSLVAAALLTLVLAGIQYFALPAFLPDRWPFDRVIVCKTVYGAGLGAVVAAVGVARLLAGADAGRRQRGDPTACGAGTPE